MWVSQPMLWNGLVHTPDEQLETLWIMDSHSDVSVQVTTALSVYAERLQIWQCCPINTETNTKEKLDRLWPLPIYFWYFRLCWLLLPTAVPVIILSEFGLGCEVVFLRSRWKCITPGRGNCMFTTSGQLGLGLGVMVRVGYGYHLYIRVLLTLFRQWPNNDYRP